MASIGGDRERLIRTFMNRNKNTRDLRPGTPQRKAASVYRPRKQGTVASYKPAKQKY